jgi:hypothetical protein
MSAIFEYTKLNLERTIQNLKTKKFEFIYEDTETFIPENKTYSIYYLLDKRELYFTNIITTKNVRKIIRLFPSIYSQYTALKSIERGVYPSAITPNITDNDYTAGSITRYFAQKTNVENPLVFEISESDFNQTLKLYNKTSINWIISGIKETVIRHNTRVIKNEERIYKGISKILFPLQYWKPSKSSYTATEKKLSLLKKD